MDREGDKNSDKDTSGEQGGGIFSTPELSVNTENLPATEATLSEDNKSRIAAAFQGTEASQKRAAAREMNEAALARSDIPSTATGDIKLPGEKKKHRKAPLIILAVLALLAIGGGVVWFGVQEGWFSNAETGQPKTPKEAFAAYRDYLEKGPESFRNGSRDNSEVSEYFLFVITNSNILSEKESSDYLKELSDKYEVFVATLGGTAKKLDDVDLDQYGRMLALFIKGASLRELRQGLLNRYLDDGANSAYNYISEVTPKQPDNEEYYAMKKISSALESYLSDELNLIELYQDLGCVSDHTLNTACGDEEGYTNSTFMELRAKQASQQEIITNYSEVLQPIFSSQTGKISEALELVRNEWP